MDHHSRDPFPVEPSRGPGASPPSNSAARLKPRKFTQIDIPSYPSLQTTDPPQNRTNPPVKRKPLPASAVNSPAVTNFSPKEDVGAATSTATREGPAPSSINHTNSFRASGYQTNSGSSPKLVVRDLDQFPRGLSPNIPQSPGFTPFHELSADQAREELYNLDTNDYSPSTLSHVRNSVPTQSPVKQKAKSHQVQRSATMAPKHSPGPIQILPPQNVANNGPLTPGRQNHTASNKISSFFGWKGQNASSPIVDTSPTTISDRSSVANSPNGTSLSSFQSSNKQLPAAIDVPRANAPSVALFSSNSFPQAPPTPNLSNQMEEMEEELRELSTELASSIRREMELEEQIERLQLEGPGALDKDKRTSDYYSDSGNSSARDTEIGGSREEVEKLKRRSEQEKVRLKIDVSQKVQEERGRRKALEEHVRNLESHIQSMEQDQGFGNSGRIEELQNALEDNRRRLVEEKKHKENYEDLIAALRIDLVNHQNERDNLRDEVVPQLQARVEGLEAEAAKYQKLAYENARMQQELQALKSGRSISSIAEEDGPPPTPKIGLTRSASLMRGSGSGTLSRSNSVSGKERESRDSLADRVKDIEAQRDALHRALKSLLDRQKYQTREHEKRIRALGQERDRALESHSPRRRGYEKEVTDLRYEINQLRRRADDALEQKWQCEKGLGGLKKDLDRADQETSSLRKLLVENDILVPDLSSLSAPNGPSTAHATSATLEQAHKQLQDAQALSIAKLREMQALGPSATTDPQTSETLDILLQSTLTAEAERDQAQQQAATLRARAESLQDERTFVSDEAAGLAAQLHASASRAEQLSAQVARQLAANGALRERLASAVGAGEREQKASAARINALQGKLRALEDRLMAAQQRSEDGIVPHEDELRVLRRSDNVQLQRLRAFAPGVGGAGGGNGVGSGGRSPRSPVSPMLRSPRLDQTSSGQGMSMTEALRTEFLEQRVRELEAALAEAECEMGEVVQRMNAAQIDVMELQSARDEAIKQTHTLQNQIVAENEKVGSLMRFLPHARLPSLSSQNNTPTAS